MSENIFSKQERFGLRLMGWELLTDEQQKTIQKISTVLGLDVITTLMKIRLIGEKTISPRLVFKSFSDKTNYVD